MSTAMNSSFKQTSLLAPRQVSLFGKLEEREIGPFGINSRASLDRTTFKLSSGKHPMFSIISVVTTEERIEVEI